MGSTGSCERSAVHILLGIGASNSWFKKLEEDRDRLLRYMGSRVSSPLPFRGATKLLSGFDHPAPFFRLPLGFAPGPRVLFGSRPASESVPLTPTTSTSTVGDLRFFVELHVMETGGEDRSDEGGGEDDDGGYEDIDVPLLPLRMSCCGTGRLMTVVVTRTFATVGGVEVPDRPPLEFEKKSGLLDVLAVVVVIADAAKGANMAEEDKALRPTSSCDEMLAKLWMTKQAPNSDISSPVAVCATEARRIRFCGDLSSSQSQLNSQPESSNTHLDLPSYPGLPLSGILLFSTLLLAGFLVHI